MISQILKGLEVVVCQMDDILVSGANRREHNLRLMAVLDRLQAEGVTLNKEKCHSAQEEVKFL